MEFSNILLGLNGLVIIYYIIKNYMENKRREERPTNLICAGAYNLKQDRKVYFCNCTAGNIVIESIEANGHDNILFVKTDKTNNKVIIKNNDPAGYLSGDWELLEYNTTLCITH